MLEQIDKDIFLHCLPQMRAKPVVFDIGAHKGAYTDFVKEVCPDAEVYLFEPNKSLADKIKHDHVYNLAVSHTVQPIPFYLCSEANDELSSAHKRCVFEEFETRFMMVPSTTVDHFIKANGITFIDFLKVDVEGSELDVLEGSFEAMSKKRIKFLQIEYGGTYPDAGIQFTDIIKFANYVGYKVFEKTDVWKEVTLDNFVEDYRYQNFLLTY